MQNSDGEKDIGVLVDDQLNYSQHIQQKINKANSIMGLIRRTSITKENRLIPPCRRSRNTHNRAFQLQSCRIETRKMPFFPRTVRDWNLLSPDIVELDTHEAFIRPGLCPFSSQAIPTCIYICSFNCK